MLEPARPPAALHLRLAGPSLVERLASVRKQVGRWAAAAGLSQQSVDDVVLATHEALANVVDHAYADGQPEAWLDVECEDGEVIVVVRDRGRWQPPAADPGWRGRGMLIIRGLADHVDVHRGAGGTTVEMRWRLP